MPTPMAWLSKTNKQKNKATSPFGGYENPGRCSFRESMPSSEWLQQSSDLMRQLPVQIVPGLQTPFLLHSGPLSNTQPCSIASHPSGPHACLLAETHSECCSCQQRRISLPLLAPSKPSWQANGHRKVCMQKLKWDMCTRETLRLARRSRVHPGLVQR